MFEMLSVAVPILLRITDCGGLVNPTPMDPKNTKSVLNAAAGRSAVSILTTKASLKVPVGNGWTVSSVTGKS